MIKYIFALLLITNYSKVISMQFDAEDHKIREIGMTANIKKAQELLNSGMNVNAKDTFMNYTMLLHAISYLHETEDNKIPTKKRLEFIEFLLENGAELNPQTDKWTRVPMLIAASSNIGPEIIALFIKYGGDINMTHSSNGMSALHLAAWNGHEKVIKFLLSQKNIQIDVQDNDGRSPLIRAAFWGHEEVAKMLVEHGANITIKDKTDRTAFDYIESNASHCEKKCKEKLITMNFLKPVNTELQNP